MWRGLARYRIPEEGPRTYNREEREYAKVTTLLDTPLLECTYYHDVPGEPYTSGLSRSELIDRCRPNTGDCSYH